MRFQGPHGPPKPPQRKIRGAPKTPQRSSIDFQKKPRNPQRLPKDPQRLPKRIRGSPKASLRLSKYMKPRNPDEAATHADEPNTALVMWISGMPLVEEAVISGMP